MRDVGPKAKPELRSTPQIPDGTSLYSLQSEVTALRQGLDDLGFDLKQFITESRRRFEEIEKSVACILYDLNAEALPCDCFQDGDD